MTVRTMKKVPTKALLMPATDCPVKLGVEAASGEQQRRTFSMLVHTGKPVSTYFWGQLVVNLDGIEFAQRLPLLNEHRTDERLGFTTAIERSADGLRATGVLLDNELTKQISAEADQGMPFQASCYLVPTKVTEVMAGQDVEVNGRKLTGPLYVFDACLMREVTLATLGADDQTTTEVLAAGGMLEVAVLKHEEHPMNEEEQKAAALAEAQKKADADKAALAAAADAAQKAERARVAAIMAAADESQSALAQKLCADGIDQAAALAQLQADSKAKLAAARTQFGVQGGSLAAGERGEDRATVPAEVALMGVDQAKHAWSQQPKLRAEFDQDERIWLAFAGKAFDKRTGSEKFRASGWPDGGIKLGAGLPQLGYRNIVGRYYLALQEREMKSWASKVATMMTTDQLVEVIRWLSDAPAMKKWEGERVPQNLKDFGLQLIGDKYTNTVPIDIDDLRRDKTGQIMLRINELAGKAATLPQRLLSAVLTGNALAHDGTALYADTRAIGASGNIDNSVGLSVAAIPNTSGSVTDPGVSVLSYAILKGIAAMRGFRDSAGDPMNEDAESFLVMVPTEYWHNSIAALSVPFSGAGVSNILPAANVKIELAVNPRLTSPSTTGDIFVFRTDASINALLFQDEEIGAEAFKTLGPESDSGFFKDAIHVGAKRISAAAAGRPELTTRVRLSA